MQLAALLAAAALGGGAPSSFQGEITPVRWDELRHSYRAGCPVGPAQLRSVHVSYRDFQGRGRQGTIVVARRVAPQVLKVFRFLWAAGFPIRRMRPVSVYRGSDERSMAADNTSGFNCRYVRGTSRWSMHAYGEAIDVNPVENPYVQGSRVSPAAGRAYLDRSSYRKGMATPDSAVVAAFESVGWKWGASFGDYQHFSTTGR